VKTARRGALLPLLAAALLLVAAGTQVDGSYHADPEAPEVTAGNLLARERFWPYQVELVEPWQPPGRAKPLPEGTRGVLIRIGPPGRARIDFGRDGTSEVPLDRTDVLARANRIRLGEAPKSSPNFAHAIGPRLVDAAAPRIRALDVVQALRARGFVAVFADPGADGFSALAAVMEPLPGRPDVQTVLFAQGAHPDRELRQRLRKLGWTVPFLRDTHAEGYTMALRDADTPLPAVMVLTPEGRVLLDEPFDPGLPARIRKTLDDALGPVPEAAAAAPASEAREEGSGQ